MSWRVAITHSSGYRYRDEVRASYNEARITPLTTHRQSCIDAGVTVEPAVRIHRYWDYWGTSVHAFDVHTPHAQLVVTGTSVVETAPSESLLDLAGWDRLQRSGTVDELTEYLEATAYAPDDADLRDVAARLAAASPTPSDAAQAASQWVRASLTYQPGGTDVHTSGLESWRQGIGVCQDFAHLTLILLRAMGVPGRYVSGYLHPQADADVGHEVSGQSHAWVEFWAGDWRGLDPTNGVPVGERHVIVGRGRDYADVSPLKGIYSGGPARALDVSVRLTRLA